MDLEALKAFITEAFANGQFAIGVSVLIMVALWVVGRQPFLKEYIKDRNVLAWVSLGTGVLGSVATNIMAGKSWSMALVEGLTVGAAASGLWSTVGKSSLGAIDAAQAPVPPSDFVEEEDTKRTKRRARKR